MDCGTCEILKVIGDPSRFKILEYLLDEPRNVSEIVREVGLQQSLVSHHLKILRKNGILKAMREGPFIRYTMNSLEVKSIFNLAENIARKNSHKGDDNG